MILLVRLLVLWGINTLALIVVDWMFDSVTIGRWGSPSSARQSSRSGTRF